MVALAPVIAHHTPLVHSTDFIHIYSGDPAVLRCDEIIEHSEQGEWDRSKIVGAKEPEFNKRDSYQQSYFAYQATLDEDALDATQQSFSANGDGAVHVHRPMLDFASDCLDKYLEAFPQANNMPTFSVAEQYQVLRYFDGGAYHALHSDYYPAGFLSRRHLTGVGFLNDVKSGGQLLFPQQGFSVNPEVGKFVIFPSGWTHSHKTLPPVGQSRYVFQMWWSFDEEAV